MPVTINDLAKSIKTGKFSPIYLLMGPESYFIDYLCNMINQYSLLDEEKELNLTILYGKDVNAEMIIQQSLRYPILAKRQVVIVKELQNMADDIDKLQKYAKHVQPTTVLVLCYKNGTIDKRKKIVNEISKVGIVYEAEKIKESLLPQFVQSYIRKNKFNIEDNALQLFIEHTGNDLTRIINELNKLFIASKNNLITTEDVISKIGLNKEYNVFELKDAIITKDILKANTIVNYIEEHAKTYPIQVILSILFNFFSNLMMSYYAPGRDQKSVSTFLNLKSEWQAKEYIKAMNNYSGKKVMEIINAIKNTDAKSKGFGSTNNNTHLLKELVYFIIH